MMTHKGAYRVKRLQFGVSVAPNLFQRFTDTRLARIPGALSFFDDILKVGNGEKQLAERLSHVLQRFAADGLRIKREKYMYNVDSLEFLGHQLTAEGIRPTDSKVRAIKNAPVPKTKVELQAFLGLLLFYSAFLRERATIAEPLHRLLKKDVEFKWTKTDNIAFEGVKKFIFKYFVSTLQ